MIYLYWGSDTRRTADALSSAVARLRLRAPDAHVERITDEAEALDIDSLLQSVGLFHTARVVILDGLFGTPAFKEAILDNVEELAASSHIFFIREEKLSAPDLKKLSARASAVVHHELQGVSKKEAFNTFSLADALLAKDKKNLWLGIVQALRSGAEPEELHGILFWGAKSLFLAIVSRDAVDSGLSPFVYRKASKAKEKFTREEASALVASLAELPHRARREGVELEYALELFALGG